MFTPLGGALLLQLSVAASEQVLPNAGRVGGTDYVPSVLMSVQELNETKGMEVAFSCAFAVSLDSGTDCATECDAVCGFAANSQYSWAAPLSFAECLDQLSPTCMVPVGVHSTFEPVGGQIRVLKKDYTDTAPQRGGSVGSSSETYHWHGYEKMFVIGLQKSDLSKLVDPLRLTWMTARLSDSGLRVNDRLQCIHAVSMVEFGSASSTGWGPGLYSYSHSASLNLGPLRGLGSSTLQNPDGRVRNSVSADLGGQGVYLPNLASLVQGLFLTGDYDWTETPGFGILMDNLGREDVVSAAELDVLVSESAAIHNAEASLESFTTFDWAVHVPLECQALTDCTSCTLHSFCTWCDMTNAPLDEWTAHIAKLTPKRSSPIFQGNTNDTIGSKGGHPGGAGNVASTPRAGSVCGLAPSACAMLGGEPVIDQCRPAI